MIRLYRLALPRSARRWYSVPFGDELSPVDDELFGLEDFQYYKEYKPITKCGGFDQAVIAKQPMIFISRETDPFLNLAIENYIYTKMPLDNNCFYDRLLFYCNSPCVVIGKNQNPWKEVNLPLLNSLHLPILRRNSGGGTVVHDLGNVNFSFMTTKANFDRNKFVNIIVDAVNQSQKSKYQLKVNKRGDITTVAQTDGVEYKISGSAYKLSKGKSYHHGTMLLSLNLDVLGKLLHTSDKNGIVSNTTSIASVKSPVANLELNSTELHEIVSKGFKNQYDDLNNAIQTFIIDKDIHHSQEIIDHVQQLKSWEWKFGNTPKFVHEFYNRQYGVRFIFTIGKGAIIEDLQLQVTPENNDIKESFDFLMMMIRKGNVAYKGSDIAGLITHDPLSDWIGQSIDATL